MVRFTERDNFELYSYQSYYLIGQTFHLSRENRKKTHIGFDGLKVFLKNVGNTESQIASRKQKANILTKNGTLYCT